MLSVVTGIAGTDCACRDGLVSLLKHIVLLCNICVKRLTTLLVVRHYFVVSELSKSNIDNLCMMQVTSTIQNRD